MKHFLQTSLHLTVLPLALLLAPATGARANSSLPAPNDDCALALPVGPGTFSYDNCLATGDGPAESCGFTGQALVDKDVWFEFTMPADGLLLATFPPVTPFEQVLAIYNLCPLMGGASLGCVFAPPGASNTLAVRGLAGQPLWIRVGGRFGQCGFGQVRFSYVPSQGTAYCFSGASAPCPCANPGAPGQGCANSSGVGGTLTNSGNPLIFPDLLEMHGSGMIPGQPALLFGALNQAGGGLGIAFGDGLRCAGGNVVRLGVRIPNAGGDATWGPGIAAALGLSPGSTRRFQTWYRDPGGPCGSGFNLSHGLELTFF